MLSFLLGIELYLLFGSRIKRLVLVRRTHTTHTNVRQARQLSGQLEAEAGDCEALRMRLQAMEEENDIR